MFIVLWWNSHAAIVTFNPFCRCVYRWNPTPTVISLMQFVVQDEPHLKMIRRLRTSRHWVFYAHTCRRCFLQSSLPANRFLFDFECKFDIIPVHLTQLISITLATMMPATSYLNTFTALFARWSQCFTHHPTELSQTSSRQMYFRYDKCRAENSLCTVERKSCW